MAYATAEDRRRWPGALAAGLVQMLLVLLVIQGLAADYVERERRGSATTLVALTHPPQGPEPPPRRDAEPAGEGAPPARRAAAAPREAPAAQLVVAPPRPAASLAGRGEAEAAGLAPAAGSGWGAGGRGDGLGAGAGGSGRGAGAVPPARIVGALGDRDYPRSAARRRASGTTAVSFRVRPDGRVDRCVVIASSGDAELDSLTCALVERRFLYRPALNAAGEPVAATLRSTFTWGTR